jgi:hypothetical protein
MKKIVTALFVFTAFLANAQWSNTSNEFYDSLHMPVCEVAGEQGPSLIVKSYPDSGYFVIWEDFRNGAGNRDIYAQKFDKNGVALWAANGVPVATGPDVQTFSRFGNADYRAYPHACSDSSGGFYIAWGDYNLVNTGVTNAQRVCAQYINASGSAAYPGIGLIVNEPIPEDLRQAVLPMLIPDGKKGFFLGFIKEDNTVRDLYIVAYRNEGGFLIRYFTDKMDPDVHQGIRPSTVGCVANQYYFNFVDDRVTDYCIYPDLENGCGVVWTFSRNIGAARFMAFNRLCRVKKNCASSSLKRAYLPNIANLTDQGIVNKSYKKDSIVKIYNLTTFSYTANCVPVTVLNQHIENFGEGYLLLEDNLSNVVDLYYPKGLALTTTGNINAMVITANLRQSINNQVTDMITRGYFTEPIEKFDSIPYQLASDMTQPYFAYNTTAPLTLNKINRAIDTVMDAGNRGLGSAYIFNDYTLAGGGNRACLAKLSYVPSYNINDAAVLLQEIKAERVNADSFAIYVNTASKKGVVVGREVNTGFSETDIFYNPPAVAMDASGNAVFYIREAGRSVRVSPIDDSARLRWGPMGKPIGNRHGAGAEAPFIVMAGDGTAVVAWHDNRSTITGNNIYMRHLGGFNDLVYFPAPKIIKPLLAFGSSVPPQVIAGKTKKWAEFNFTAGTDWTTVIQVSDNYDLGVVNARAYEHNAAIRTYSGKAYLDRNYLVNPENDPAGAATVNIRLFFTTVQFDALKTADPTITSPANLVVIKQTGTTNIPSVYVPVAGEQTIVPTSWNSVPGGYYLDIVVNSFSNFFILKGTNALPVTWLNVHAQKINEREVTVTWQVSNERNVKNYTVQHGTNGLVFTDACTINANGSTRYECKVSASSDKTNYYRILETDNDGWKAYSRTVTVKSGGNGLLSLFPNPAGSSVHLRVGENIHAVTIYDMQGRSVFNRQYNAQQTIIINTEKLPKGVYTLQAIDQSGAVHSCRLTIQ